MANSVRLSIFGVVLEKQVQNFVNSVPDESFNNSFIFDFQPGFLGALSSLKRLVSGDVLLSYISNKVRFNSTLISEDAIGSKFNYTHISFISKSNAKFSKLYWGVNRGNDTCSQTNFDLENSMVVSVFPDLSRLRVIDCFRTKNVNPDFVNNVPHFDFK